MEILNFAKSLFRKKNEISSCVSKIKINFNRVTEIVHSQAQLLEEFHHEIIIALSNRSHGKFGTVRADWSFDIKIKITRIVAVFILQMPSSKVSASTSFSYFYGAKFK